VANDEPSAACNQLVVDGRVDPCRSQVFPFTEIGEAHQVIEGLTDLPSSHAG
jgi:hypothetical protein